jgi:hypothetical protein
MLKKLKVTSCVFILCLFGLTLMPVSPVSAQTFPECSEMKKGSKRKECRKACKEYAESAGRTGKCAMPVSLTPLEQAISDVQHLCAFLLGTTHSCNTGDGRTTESNHYKKYCEKPSEICMDIVGNGHARYGIKDDDRP